MTIKIIALTGRAGSGKSTVARHLVDEHDFVLVKFAEPLKWMLQAIGLTHEEIEGDAKETESNTLNGKTPREAMISLGHSWGRETMSQDFWVNIWKDRVKTLIAQGYSNIVTDDCRYPNEEEALADMGGTIWKVTRPHNPTSLIDHISEKSTDLIEVSEVLENEKDIHHLQFIIDTLYEENFN